MVEKIQHGVIQRLAEGANPVGSQLDDNITIAKLMSWSRNWRGDSLRPPESWQEFIESLDPNDRRVINCTLARIRRDEICNLGELRRHPEYEIARLFFTPQTPANNPQ